MNRIVLSIAIVFALGACRGKGGDTTPVQRVARDFAKCLGKCATACAGEVISNGIGTSPSEPAKDPE